jgi:hypothetical protein
MASGGSGEGGFRGLGIFLGYFCPVHRLLGRFPPSDL